MVCTLAWVELHQYFSTWVLLAYYVSHMQLGELAGIIIAKRIKLICTWKLIATKTYTSWPFFQSILHKHFWRVLTLSVALRIVLKKSMVFTENTKTIGDNHHNLVCVFHISKFLQLSEHSSTFSSVWLTDHLKRSLHNVVVQHFLSKNEMQLRIK